MHVSFCRFIREQIQLYRIIQPNRNHYAVPAAILIPSPFFSKAVKQTDCKLAIV